MSAASAFFTEATSNQGEKFTFINKKFLHYIASTAKSSIVKIFVKMGKNPILFIKRDEFTEKMLFARLRVYVNFLTSFAFVGRNAFI